MKKIINTPYQPLTSSELRELTQEVKETLDLQPVTGQRKAFSSADLWSIQRRYKTGLGIRRFL